MAKAFILDLDGTLLDSMGAWGTIGTRYLTSKGFEGIPEDIEEIIKPFSNLECAQYFVSEWGIDLPIEAVSAEINSLMEDFYKNEVRLKEGVLEFLEKYRDKRMCIATATDRYLVDYALKRVGLENRFEFVITSGEVGSGKRDPEIFIKAADKLGVKISEAVVFEDALHAILAAKSAGFYTIGVYEKLFEEDKEQIMAAVDEYFYRLSDF